MSDNLKSVTDHNAERRAARAERERLARLTGVACPWCGKELLWVENQTLRHYAYQTMRVAQCVACANAVELEM